MNQSKMSSINGKEFVIKHSFENLMDLENDDSADGEEEYHCNIPWRMRILRLDSCFCFVLECTKEVDDDKEWSIDATVTGKITKRSGIDSFSRDMSYPYNDSEGDLDFAIEVEGLCEYTLDRKLIVEYHVKITGTTGIEVNKLRIFDNDSAKELSDITLIVGDQKFHVWKMYLATHCTYFKSMFLGNYQESGKSEIELKNIDPEDMQNFLEVLYTEPAIQDDNINGILKLADFFDSKTAIKRCEEFLCKESKQPLEMKFAIANQYCMETLKTKCLSEMNTVDDIRSVIPEDGDEFNGKVWKELCLKLISHCK